MPNHRDDAVLTPTERRRRIAAILAKGVTRWRQQAKAVGFIHARKSAQTPRISLELPGETRLSVSDGTRGLSPRDNGDEA